MGDGFRLDWLCNLFGFDTIILEVELKTTQDC